MVHALGVCKVWDGLVLQAKNRTSPEKKKKTIQLYAKKEEKLVKHH